MPRTALPDFANHDKAMARLSRYSQRFILSPECFKKGLTLPALTWTTVKFTATQINTVAAEPGLYAFSVVTSRIGLPPHGYVLYVGQTGAKKNSRTLRVRAGEYLKEEKSGKRRHVWEFLNKWSGHLSFHYVPVDPQTQDLEAIEKTLNDALMPPYSVNDFSAEIKAQKKAWQYT
jgi:hypothetical protein